MSVHQIVQNTIKFLIRSWLDLSPLESIDFNLLLIHLKPSRFLPVIFLV